MAHRSNTPPAIVAALFLAACGGAQHAPAVVEPLCAVGDTATPSDDVSLTCVAYGVWVFTALAAPDFTYPRYPANGLVVGLDDPPRSVLVDTGWSDAEADALVRFGIDRGRPIAAAIVTHFHGDRVGGVAALELRGIPVFATDATRTRAIAAHAAVPDRVLETDSIPEITWLFPGAAHSPDNIVVWLPASRTLFGGCMIKEESATSLGNLSDADLAAWPRAIETLRAHFPDPLVVVPGHGAIGGPELLAHTATLIEEATHAAPVQ